MGITTNRSRIKGLTPKVQLRNADSLKGAYSTGDAFIKPFDDTKTLVFKSYPSSLMLGSGLPSGSIYLTGELTSSIVTTGVLRKGVGDTWVTQSFKETYTPFRDSQKYQSDGKQVLSRGIQDPFWATGSAVSAVGQGFDQPVWSKTAVEIDLSITTPTTLGVSNYTSGSLNFPMMYWNNTLKKFEGIGTGKQFQNYNSTSTGLGQLLEEQCVGFAWSMDEGGLLPGNINTSILMSYGAPIGNFGFPYHAKFQPTGSNLIPMSSSITRPFLVEKMVLEFSGGLTLNNTVDKTDTNSTISTFFVLNKRAPFGVTIPNFQTISWTNGVSGINTIVTGVQIPQIFNGQLSPNTIMDLVTWTQVSAVTANARSVITTGSVGLLRELNFPSTSIGEWNGRFLMSGTVKSPTQAPAIGAPFFWRIDNGGGFFYQFNQTRATSTRSGLSIGNGRDFLNTVQQSQITTTPPTFQLPITLLTNYSKQNPYLLLPTDNLVVGWQVPLHQFMNESVTVTPEYSGSGPQLSFTGPSKLVLYGSYINQDTEVHDMSVNVLTSKAVHEIIG
jgi:hypothetical protein